MTRGADPSGYIVAMHAYRHHHRCTLDDYFELELVNERKFEFFDGAILAMAGASIRHNDVAMNVAAILHGRQPTGCRTRGSDQRIATGDGLYTYPDVSVVCGTPIVSRYKGTETIHNPSVLVEVLSKSTREYDLGEKLDHYQTTPTLRDVLLVEPETVDVRHVRRTDAGWETRRFHTLEDVVQLACGEVVLRISEIYDLADEVG